jgi:hypothetical protein
MWHGICSAFVTALLGFSAIFILREAPDQFGTNAWINFGAPNFEPMKFLAEPRSGSYQGVTSSRNRFGQYLRTRATPVNPNSTFQVTVRTRMSLNASAWRLLTALQRTGWNDLGLQIARSDSLGQTYAMNGFMAYCSVNNNRLAAGDAVLSDAPIYTEPAALFSITPTLTSGSFSLAFTATPLPAATRLFWYAGPQRTAGRSFENDVRLINVTAASAASPTNILAPYQARFGTPVTGNRIFIAGAVYSNGFVSQPLLVSQVVA